MTYPVDIPGYVQGFRFSDDPVFYDADKKAFRDLAGYGPANDLVIDTGTPNFVTSAAMNSQRGLELDNTFHGSFLPAITWEGTIVVVMKTDMDPNIIIYPVLWTNRTSPAGGSGVLQVDADRVSYGVKAYVILSRNFDVRNGPAVFAASLSQETRKGSSQINTSSSTTSTALEDDDRGNGLAIGFECPERARFGDLDADPSNTTITSNLICSIFEMHFFSSIALVDYPSKMNALMASLRSKYGIS